jgi:hypothetical protein
MNRQLISAIIGISAIVSVAQPQAAQAQSAGSFTWNNHWTQGPILNAATTGFDHTQFQPFVQQERLELSNASLLKVDLSKLKLKNDYTPTAYFINEAAGYRNQLAYQATGTTTRSDLLFGDISCGAADVGCAGGFGAGDALNLGDGVSLGALSAGTQLDFWLRADGFNRQQNGNLFGTQDEVNLDALQHAVAYSYNGFLLLGFEDLYGGLNATGVDANGIANEQSDRDFNDVVFVIDIGKDNLDDITKVPEPGAIGAIVMAATAGLGAMRRRLFN